MKLCRLKVSLWRCPINYLPDSTAMPVSGASSAHVFVVAEDQRSDKIRIGMITGRLGDAFNSDRYRCRRDCSQHDGSGLRQRGFVIASGPTSSEVRLQILRSLAQLSRPLSLSAPITRREAAIIHKAGSHLAPANCSAGRGRAGGREKNNFRSAPGPIASEISSSTR